MVKSSSGKAGYRSFTVINVAKRGGCKTKFHGGRYKGKTAAIAARKAFTEFCRVKNVRGVCTLVVVLKETTRGSSGKAYVYKLQRHKLKEPIIRLEGSNNEFVIEYRSTIKALKKVPETCRTPSGEAVQTVGRMKKHTAKKTRKTANNVRRNRTRSLSRNNNKN